MPDDIEGELSAGIEIVGVSAWLMLVASAVEAPATTGVLAAVEVPDADGVVFSTVLDCGVDIASLEDTKTDEAGTEATGTEDTLEPSLVLELGEPTIEVSETSLEYEPIPLVLSGTTSVAENSAESV